MQVTTLHPSHRPGTRYGDTAVIRDLARSMRSQGQQIEAEGDLLDRRAATAPWTGLAADAMRRSVSVGTTSLRRTAELHFRAAVALDDHADEVDRIARLIDHIEHGVLGLVHAAQQRLAGLVGDAVDDVLARFDPPPSGHRDWLTVHLPIAVPGLALTEAVQAVR